MFFYNIYIFTLLMLLAIYGNISATVCLSHSCSEMMSNSCQLQYSDSVYYEIEVRMIMFTQKSEN